MLVALYRQNKGPHVAFIIHFLSLKPSEAIVESYWDRTKADVVGAPIRFQFFPFFIFSTFIEPLVEFYFRFYAVYNLCYKWKFWKGQYLCEIQHTQVRVHAKFSFQID